MKVAQLHGTDPGRADEVVAQRMRRTQILYDTSKTFEFCFAEGAFRHPLCSPEEMLIQIDRLLSVFGLPNVTIGIIPFDRELDIIPVVGFFMVDSVLTSESFTSEHEYTKDAAATHVDIMAKLLENSATGDDARKILLAAAQHQRQLIAARGQAAEAEEE